MLVYWALSELLRSERSFVGWTISGCCSLVILVLAVRRGLKWMMRASRPVDQARARWHERIFLPP